MESPIQHADSLQWRTLGAYLALTRRAVDWSRRLVMVEGSTRCEPIALAAVAAGAAVLWVSQNEADFRSSGQQGITDFQVVSLSEALRILKNELRRGQAVSVGVLDGQDTVWPEAVRRGVQPYAFCVSQGMPAAAEVLVERGAIQLSACPVAMDRIEVHLAQSWRERRAADAPLLLGAGQLPPQESHVALRWFQAAPRLFPRDTFRCYASQWGASN